MKLLANNRKPNSGKLRPKFSNRGKEFSLPMRALVNFNNVNLSTIMKILAGSIGIRLASINVQNTEEDRRRYRQLLFTAPNFGQNLSGVILFDETFLQVSDY